MNISDYTPIKHRRKPVSNLKQHKSKPSKFLADFRINGKRYRSIITVKSDGTNEDRILRAIHKLEELMTLKGEEVDRDVSNMSLTQYFERYVTSRALANKWSDKYLADTRRAYKLYVEKKIGSKKVAAIRSTNITDVMDGVAHLSLRSQKLVIDLLKPLFQKAVQDDAIIAKSPIQSAHLVKRNINEEKKIVTDAVAKYQIVHSTIHKLFADDPRNRALLLFGLNGRRKMETLKLKWKDIDMKTSVYTIRAENSKTKTGMTFELSSDLHEALTEMVDIFDPESYIFESITKRGTHQTKVDTPIIKLREATGIPELTYHWFRNLAVSALSAQGVEPIHLSSMLGHTDINTVNKYLSLQREASSSVTNSAIDNLLKKG